MTSFAAIASLVCAHPDERFVRMWTAAQQHRPAALVSDARIASADEPGTPLVVRGVVLDPTGRPAPGVEVAYREHYAAVGEHGLYAAVSRNPQGTEVVSYTIRIREHGNF
ncbi:MAG TPA: hypothetical protein VFZ98_08405 [Vicinamibacterales bacterium]